jgi:hypothetical protein
VKSQKTRNQTWFQRLTNLHMFLENIFFPKTSRSIHMVKRNKFLKRDHFQSSISRILVSLRWNFNYVSEFIIFSIFLQITVVNNEIEVQNEVVEQRNVVIHRDDLIWSRNMDSLK